MISKNNAIEIMDLCIMRHDANRKCIDCIYEGQRCIEAHKYAALAARVILQRDVKKEECKHEQRRDEGQG